jgi:PAS domain S-box-containing protein
MISKKPTKPAAKRRSKIRDASANSLREKKVRSRSSEHLASFPQLNPNPVLEVGAKGKILFQNRAAVEVIRGASGEDGRVFFPEDMGEILAALDEGKEEMLHREVKVNDRLFGENICLTPQFKTIQLYAIDITERRAAEEALRKNTEKFELLAETAGRLLASDDPQGAVNDLCRRVMEHLECQTFFLYLTDPDRKCLRLNSWAGLPEKTVREIEWLQSGVAICGCVARDGLPIVAEDILHLPDSRIDLVRSLGIQAYACIPLMAQGKVVGTLSFGTQTRVVFTVGELDLMRAVAGQVAAAMDRNRLLLMARRRADELDAVFSAMNEPVIVYNGEGVPVKVNAAGRDYGLDDRPEELQKLGDPKALIRMLSVRHPDGRGLTPDELPSRRALGGEKVAGENFLLRTRDGKDVDIQVSASPIVTAGKITGAVAVWNDVTERERWFHELRKAKEELELRVQ